MDITPQDNTTQSISDDQELAKALAGVLPDDAADELTAVNNLKVDEPTESASDSASTPAADTSSASVPPLDVPSAPANGGELNSIKSQALSELRPLMDHVDLPAEERFDAYLMLLRSTDDPSLVAPAHSAAQGISDEKRKAEALLEIIKEIDFLSRGSQANS